MAGFFWLNNDGKFKKLPLQDYMRIKYGDIWLVWALDTNGLTTLHAVSSANSEAIELRDSLNWRINPPPKSHVVPLIRVWIEKAVTNHLFGDEGLPRK